MSVDSLEGELARPTLKGQGGSQGRGGSAWGNPRATSNDGDSGRRKQPLLHVLMPGKPVEWRLHPEFGAKSSRLYGEWRFAPL